MEPLEGKYYMYRHIRLDTNEVFYVGIGTRKSGKNPHKRAFSKERNNFWNNIASKVKYDIEIVLESDDQEWIKQKEIEFIKLYGRRNLGEGTLCNLTDGGDGALKLVYTEEHKEKLRQANYRNGNRPPSNLGITHTEETKRKIGSANAISKKGKTMGVENHKSNPILQLKKGTNEIIYAYGSLMELERLTGLSNVTIYYYFENNSGGVGYDWKMISKEEYQSINLEGLTPGQKISSASPIKAFLPDGIEKEYSSVYYAAKDLNLTRGNIDHVLKGNRPHTKGIKFEYL